ncbi:MAG: hypothetical protein AVDCRST_MAG56-8150, partial [uncultured Cytophagales bacterium]
WTLSRFGKCCRRRCFWPGNPVLLTAGRRPGCRL